MLKLFRESCRKKHLEDLDQSDAERFINFLLLRGDGSRTMVNRVEYLRTFYRSHKLPWTLVKKDYPKYEEPLVKAYSRRAIDLLLAAAGEEESE